MAVPAWRQPRLPTRQPLWGESKLEESKVTVATNKLDLHAVVPRIAVVVVAGYIAAQMIADIASLKIGLVGGYEVDMGTFIYPITFTLRDVVHKLLGKRNARALVVSAVIINLFMALYLMWSATIPAPNGEADEFAQAFNMVLGPLWRIVIASILAEVVSELVDTEVYHWFVTKVTTRFQWLRVLFSNAVSVPIDNVIFAVGAFGALPFLTDHFLTVPWSVVWTIFLFNLVVKFGVTLLSLPLIYLAPDPDWG
jgi:uncharacterized integral membrane protein (TIGR00697 family)